MELTFGEKIKEGRKQKGLTQKQLANLIGAAHNSVSDWENNKNKPDPDTIELLCGVLNITPNYLLATSEDDFSPKEKLLIKKYRNLDDCGKETVDAALDRETERVRAYREAQERIKNLENQIATKRLYAYYGRIAAAGKSYRFEDIMAGTIEVPLADSNPNADCAIGVSGDSMEPTFCDGDIVYVKKTQSINIGDIGIFQKDNGIYIKEAGKDGLISHNRQYKPMVNEGEVVCLGKVLGKIEGDYRIVN